jgi:hypothetical protein
MATAAISKHVNIACTNLSLKHGSCKISLWSVHQSLRNYPDNIIGRLINYLLFYVPLKNISLIWRRHHCRWRATKFRPTCMLGAQGLWARRDLYRATPTVTRDLDFSGLIRRTAPGPILTRILTASLEELVLIVTGTITNVPQTFPHFKWCYRLHYRKDRYDTTGMTWPLVIWTIKWKCLRMLIGIFHTPIYIDLHITHLCCKYQLIWCFNKHSESIASNTKSPTGGIFNQNSSSRTN